MSFNSFDEQDRKELESLRKGTKKVSWFSTNVQEKTKKLCKLLKIMNFKKLGDKTCNESPETSALEYALREDFEKVAPSILNIEEEVELELKTEEESCRYEEEEKCKKEEEIKRLENESRKRAKEIYIRKLKAKKTLDELVIKSIYLHCS